MARKKTAAKTEGGEGNLLTLSEVARRTNISMPTLQRYKKLYSDRIPSQGEGRKQRYPVEALPVFKELKQENIGRRGRPKKNADEKAPPPKKKGATTGRGRKKTATKKTATKKTATKKASAKKVSSAKAAASAGLLTLSEVGKRTGISYPTLSRYLKLYGDEIPSEGEGRRRRYHPEAVEVFSRLRSESGRRGAGKASTRKSGAGGRRKSASKSTGRGRVRPATSSGSSGDDKRMAGLEKTVARLEKKLDSLVTRLRKPRRLL